MRAIIDRRAWVVALGLVASSAGSAAYADDTGIYAGGSLGQVETDFSDSRLDNILDGKDTAFKIFGGYRILDWVGVEVSYVDLGEITGKNSQPGNSFRLEEAGFNVFGMLYWSPLPAPVDFFAKGGFITSQAHVRSTSLFGTLDDSDDNVDLAFGIGAQFRFDKIAVRLEYERFELDVGDGFEKPELLSLGASYTFF